jgi:hypothetical protein
MSLIAVKVSLIAVYPKFPCPRSSLSLTLGSFGFLRRPTPPGLVPAFARPNAYSVSDCMTAAEGGKSRYSGIPFLPAARGESAVKVAPPNPDD